MPYVMFVFVELAAAAILYGTPRGIFALPIGFLSVILMLGLSFHVMARQPRPDGGSVRFACFGAAFWLAAILSLSLVFEFRSWAITAGATLFCLVTTITAIAASWIAWDNPVQDAH